MTIVNRDKIRPEILEASDRTQKELVPHLTAFFEQEENQHINFREVWGRNLDGNRYFFENKKLDDHLANLLSNDELYFLARFMRSNAEHLTAIELEHRPVPPEIIIENTSIDEVPAEWHSFPSAADNRVFLFFHGGGWILGSPSESITLTVPIAEATNMRVLSIDYRLAPEHPQPAALEDCVKSYRWLLENGYQPENIVIGGDSAGGNLTLATLLYLKDHDIPLPAAGVCLAPATDLTLSDDSYFANGETDLVLADLGIFWWLGCYIQWKNADEPYISPLFGDPKGLPPLLFQVSTSEMLYSDTTRFVEKAKQAGVNITLQTWDDTLHVFQSGDPEVMPEVKDALEKIGMFVDSNIR